jgi:hypothetical protein
MDFDTVVDQDRGRRGRPHREDRAAHPQRRAQLIEECMLAANTVRGDFVSRSKHPTLFRLHEGPTPDVSRCCASSAGRRDDAGRRRGSAPADYAAIASQIAGRPDCGLLQTMLLRSMRRRSTRRTTSVTSAVVRGLCAFHLADPALSRPADAPVDQGAAARRALRTPQPSAEAALRACRLAARAALRAQPPALST